MVGTGGIAGGVPFMAWPSPLADTGGDVGIVGVPLALGTPLLAVLIRLGVGWLGLLTGMGIVLGKVFHKFVQIVAGAVAMNAVLAYYISRGMVMEVRR